MLINVSAGIKRPGVFMENVFFGKSLDRYLIVFAYWHNMFAIQLLLSTWTYGEVDVFFCS